MYDSKRTNVCEMGKEGCIYVKKKYNGLWLKVMSHLFCNVFLDVFSTKRNI
jgi:hypothetical protein